MSSIYSVWKHWGYILMFQGRKNRDLNEKANKRRIQFQGSLVSTEIVSFLNSLFYFFAAINFKLWLVVDSWSSINFWTRKNRTRGPGDCIINKASRTSVYPRKCAKQKGNNRTEPLWKPLS